VGTASDLAAYFMLPLSAAKRRLAELVEEGQLVPVMVEGWAETAFTPPAIRVTTPKRRAAVLLSPFDSLVWGRERTRRLFGFDYRLEVYVPPPQRMHGYYVLPVLVGDRLVARLDMKADRKASALRVQAA